MKKKETSKIIATFSGICFALVLIYCIGIFTYNSYVGQEFDTTVLATLITVAGAVFGVTCTAYFNKARYENTIKIQQEFLKTKYSLLRDMGVLTTDRANEEIEEEISDLEEIMDSEAEASNQEITYEQ